MEISLTVNGVKHTLPIQPQETLAALLRYRLGLTGTKIGCGEMECGACTVLVDGEAMLSCQYPAWRAEGKEVLTIEGLARQSEAGIWYLHPLQGAFIEEGAVQCGFCIPGQIMAAYALLRQNPHPRQEEVRQALKDTLCRCGSYPAIERAVFRAAEQLRKGIHSLAFGGEQGVPPASSLIGRENIRPDALEKVTGTAIYTDDLQFPNMLYGAVRRAGVPHAIVRSIDASRARALSGVHAVLLAEDVPGENNHGLVIHDWPVLVGVGERVRYVGDALAIVAAESAEIARKAAALIEVELEELPPLTSPRAALAADAPALHPGGNLLKHIKVRKGDVEQGFSEADVILERTFYTPIYEHAFLEPECSIAVPTDDGRMEIYVGSQIPYADRAQVARALGWPPERVRVIGQTIGGGFGGKEDIAGQIHAALLANATGRPVKILFDRHESLLVHPKRHATEIRVKIGARRDGQLLAVETELYGDSGAY
ncbi:MAG: molybdopterin cofactor-binding domain-containing protein, partial [Anaerolineales bacterium]